MLLKRENLFAKRPIILLTIFFYRVYIKEEKLTSEAKTHLNKTTLHPYNTSVLIDDIKAEGAKNNAKIWVSFCYLGSIRKIYYIKGRMPHILKVSSKAHKCKILGTMSNAKRVIDNENSVEKRYSLHSMFLVSRLVSISPFEISS